MKKNLKIVFFILITILGILILDTVQAKLFNNTPLFKIIESYDNGSLYQKDSGILVYTYIYRNGTKKTVFKWEKYDLQEETLMDSQTSSENIKELNGCLYKHFTPTFNNEYDYKHDMIYANKIYHKVITNYDEYMIYKNRWNSILDMEDKDFENYFMVITAIENTSMEDLTISDIHNTNSVLYIDMDESKIYNNKETCISIIIPNELKSENVEVRDMRKVKEELNVDEKQDKQIEEGLKYIEEMYYDNEEITEKVKIIATTEDKKTSYILLKDNVSGEDEYVTIYQSKDDTNIWNKMSTQKMKVSSVINLSARNSMGFNEEQNDVWYYANSEDEYYGTKDGGKTFSKILSYKEAFEIASEEVKKDKYVEKSFGNGFSRNLPEDYYSMQGENLERNLIVIEKNTKLQFLGPIDKGTIIDENKIKGQLVWGIFLSDNIDPLTSIHIFIDATNGEVIGSGVYGD